MEKVSNGPNVFRDQRSNEIYVADYENSQTQRLQKRYEQLTDEFEKQTVNLKSANISWSISYMSQLHIMSHNRQ